MTTRGVIFWITIAVLSVNNVLGQEPEEGVVIEAQLYKPKQAIKKVIKEISGDLDCFRSDKSNEPLNKQHLFVFNYDTASNQHFLVTTSAASVVDRSLLEWDDLTISGIVIFKNNVVFLTFNRDETNQSEALFRKTNKRVKVEVNVTDYPQYWCGASFKLIGKKYKLLEKSESWN